MHGPFEQVVEAELLIRVICDKSVSQNEQVRVVLSVTDFAGASHSLVKHPAGGAATYQRHCVCCRDHNRDSGCCN